MFLWSWHHATTSFNNLLYDLAIKFSSGQTDVETIRLAIGIRAKFKRSITTLIRCIFFLSFTTVSRVIHFQSDTANPSQFSHLRATLRGIASTREVVGWKRYQQCLITHNISSFCVPTNSRNSSTNNREADQRRLVESKRKKERKKERKKRKKERQGGRERERERERRRYRDTERQSKKNVNRRSTIGGSD